MNHDQKKQFREQQDQIREKRKGDEELMQLRYKDLILRENDLDERIKRLDKVDRNKIRDQYQQSVHFAILTLPFFMRSTKRIMKLADYYFNMIKGQAKVESMIERQEESDAFQHKKAIEYDARVAEQTRIGGLTVIDEFHSILPTDELLEKLRGVDIPTDGTTYIPKEIK